VTGPADGVHVRRTADGEEWRGHPPHGPWRSTPLARGPRPSEQNLRPGPTRSVGEALVTASFSNASSFSLVDQRKIMVEDARSLTFASELPRRSSAYAGRTASVR
jgi:hypothetical protein